MWRLAIVVVVACGDNHPSNPPPDADVDPCRVSGPNGNELISMEPATLPLRGGAVQLLYNGPLAPGYYDVALDGHTGLFGVVDDDGALRLHLPEVESPQTIDLEVRDAIGNTLMAHHCIGTYVEMLERPAFAWTSSTLGIPLHPELDRPCARRASAELRNTGDMLRVLSVAAAGDGFSVTADMCTGTSVRSNAVCTVGICFSSHTNTDHHVALSIDTTAGAATLEATAVVLPTSALDTSFAGDGAVDALQTQSIYFQDVDVTPLGGGLLTWVRWTYGYTYVTATGVAQRPTFPMLNAHGFLARVVWDVVETPAGGYVLATDDSGGTYGTVFRISATGAHDPSFVNVDVPLSPQGAMTTNLLRAIEYQAPGRLLVIGRNTVTALATSNGALDSSYGTNGHAFLAVNAAFERGSAVDASGRLYVNTAQGLVRITATGSIDGTFNAPHVDALTLVNDLPLVAIGTTVSKLDETGIATPALPSPASANVHAVRVDAAGRLYLTLSTGSVVRYASDGSPLGVVGLPSAQLVECIASGCYELGIVPLVMFMDETYVARLP